MSQSKQMVDALEIMRRGASLLSESCPRCGGLQVKFRGRTLCIAEDDISDTVKTEVIGIEDALSGLRDLSIKKIRELGQDLGEEKDLDKQIKKAVLLRKYVDLLKESSAMSSPPNDNRANEKGSKSKTSESS